jgi:hypothetical protein
MPDELPRLTCFLKNERVLNNGEASSVSGSLRPKDVIPGLSLRNAYPLTGFGEVEDQQVYIMAHSATSA